MVPAFAEAHVRGVILLASNAGKLAATERSVKEADPSIDTLTYPLDISDPASVDSAFHAIKHKFGHADILISAAGIMTGDGPKLHETDLDEWWRNFVSCDIQPTHDPINKKRIMGCWNHTQVIG